MPTESTTQEGRRTRTLRIVQDGVVCSLIAGIGMGIVLSIGTDLIPLIGALYGREGFVFGWIAHLANSIIFGLIFVVIVSRPLARPDSATSGTYLGYGLLYGAMLEIVTGGVLFPLWLQAAGASGVPFPYFPISGDSAGFLPAIFLGVGHLIYGVLLGATYAVTGVSRYNH